MIAPLTLNGKTFQVTRKADGGSPRDRIYWTAECPFKFPMQDAADIQKSCGFDPCGYGFDSFHLTSTPAGYRATWYCSACCD